jgi:hypothetical protein
VTVPVAFCRRKVDTAIKLHCGSVPLTGTHVFNKEAASIVQIIHIVIGDSVGNDCGSLEIGVTVKSAKPTPGMTDSMKSQPSCFGYLVEAIVRWINVGKVRIRPPTKFPNTKGLPS